MTDVMIIININNIILKLIDQVVMHCKHKLQEFFKVIIIHLSLQLPSKEAGVTGFCTFILFHKILAAF